MKPILFVVLSVAFFQVGLSLRLLNKSPILKIPIPAGPVTLTAKALKNAGDSLKAELSGAVPAGLVKSNLLATPVEALKTALNAADSTEDVENDSTSDSAADSTESVENDSTTSDEVEPTKKGLGAVAGRLKKNLLPVVETPLKPGLIGASLAAKAVKSVGETVRAELSAVTSPGDVENNSSSDAVEPPKTVLGKLVAKVGKDVLEDTIATAVDLKKVVNMSGEEGAMDRAAAAANLAMRGAKYAKKAYDMKNSSTEDAENDSTSDEDGKPKTGLGKLVAKVGKTVVEDAIATAKDLKTVANRSGEEGTMDRVAAAANLAMRGAKYAEKVKELKTNIENAQAEDAAAEEDEPPKTGFGALAGRFKKNLKTLKNVGDSLKTVLGDETPVEDEKPKSAFESLKYGFSRAVAAGKELATDTFESGKDLLTMANFNGEDKIARAKAAAKLAMRSAKYAKKAYDLKQSIEQSASDAMSSIQNGVSAITGNAV